ncbi:MAG: hypothetical protein WAW88_06205 [Nocardioides sp.]
MSERAAPFHCPYCGEGDLYPHAPDRNQAEGRSGHGMWECHGCQRAFRLSFLGLLRPRAGATEVSP